MYCLGLLSIEQILFVIYPYIHKQLIWILFEAQIVFFFNHLLLPALPAKEMEFPLRCFYAAPKTWPSAFNLSPKFILMTLKNMYQHIKTQFFLTNMIIDGLLLLTINFIFIWSLKMKEVTDKSRIGKSEFPACYLPFHPLSRHWLF